MIKTQNRIAALFLFMMVFFMAGYGGAIAEPAPTSTPVSTTSTAGGSALGSSPAMQALNQVCGDAFQITDQSQQLKVVSGMAKCFDFIIGNIAIDSISKVTSYMTDIIATLLTLYVIFFGAKIALGFTTEQKSKGELALGGIKIGFIVFLFFNYGVIEMWYMTLDVYSSMVSIVMSPVSVEGCTTTGTGIDALWNTMDCLLAKFLGWGQTNGAGNKSEAPLLFAFFGSLFTAGLGGGLIAVVVVFALYGVLTAFFRVVFVYIFSMIGLLIMFSIAPIFIPLVLFEKTKEYFDKWWQLVVSMIVQPVLLFAFMGFMVMMFEEMMVGEGGLLEVFKQTLPQGQTYQTARNGTFLDVIQAWQNFDDKKAIELTKELSYSLISTLAVAYILIAFSDFVDDIGHELSGNRAMPKLSNFMPKGIWS